MTLWSIFDFHVHFNPFLLALLIFHILGGLVYGWYHIIYTIFILCSRIGHNDLNLLVSLNRGSNGSLLILFDWIFIRNICCFHIDFKRWRWAIKLLLWLRVMIDYTKFRRHTDILNVYRDNFAKYPYSTLFFPFPIYQISSFIW